MLSKTLEEGNEPGSPAPASHQLIQMEQTMIDVQKASMAAHHVAAAEQDLRQMVFPCRAWDESLMGEWRQAAQQNTTIKQRLKGKGGHVLDTRTCSGRVTTGIESSTLVLHFVSNFMQVWRIRYRHCFVF